MPPREWRDRLSDILARIADVELHMAGMTFEQFAADRRTNQAVRYCLGIIGEAARNVPEGIRDRYPMVPWRQVIGMRNFLAHVYWATDDTVLWDTATHDLAPLRQHVARILADHPESEASDLNSS